MIDKYDTTAVGLRIANLRHSHKMTQDQLAEQLDVSTKHISHVERGCANLSMTALIELCEIFGCSIDYIVFGRENDPILSQIPQTISDILLSDDEEDIACLKKYLEIFSELYNRKRN